MLGAITQNQILTFRLISNWSTAVAAFLILASLAIINTFAVSSLNGIWQSPISSNSTYMTLNNVTQYCETINTFNPMLSILSKLATVCVI